MAAQNHYTLVKDENYERTKNIIFEAIKNIKVEILLCALEAKEAIETWKWTQDEAYPNTLKIATDAFKKMQREADAKNNKNLIIKKTPFVPLSLSIVDDSIMVIVPNVFKPDASGSRPAFVIKKDDNAAIFNSYYNAYKNRFMEGKYFSIKITDGAILSNGILELLPPRAKETYQIIELLGKGEMGATYKAEDSDGSFAALKKLHSHLVHDEDQAKKWIRRIKREYNLLKSIKHLNVVKVYDFYSDESIQPKAYWIAEEFIIGGSLNKKIESDGVFKPSKCLEVLIQIAHGLAEVHRINIIHRDIKPDNILISGDDLKKTYKIADFGLACPVGTETSVGGTPKFWPPEQSKRDNILKPCADVYAFARMAYALMLGEAAIGDTGIPKFASCLPEKITRVLNICLSESPDKRIQNGIQLLEELKKVRL